MYRVVHQTKRGNTVSQDYTTVRTPKNQSQYYTYTIYGYLAIN